MMMEQDVQRTFPRGRRLFLAESWPWALWGSFYRRLPQAAGNCPPAGRLLQSSAASPPPAARTAEPGQAATPGAPPAAAAAPELTGCHARSSAAS